MQNERVNEGSYDNRIPSGIPGLDEVLDGGFPKHGLYLLQGNPGVGKTTFALQFLLAGVKAGERTMYVSFSETRAELHAVGRAHDWSLDGVALYELGAAEQRTPPQAEQTMFHPAEVELDETTAPLLEEVRRIKPTRLAIDSLSEIRLLARDPLRYRRQLLALKQFFLAHQCTVLLVDDKIATKNDDVVQTIVHGIISLEKLTPIYGSTRRRLMVEKLRGVGYREGLHDYRIAKGGLAVFPRLVASEHGATFTPGKVASGIAELDALVAGGLDRGTSTLIMGSAGTGKSSLASQYALAAAGRGERSVILSFEESFSTWRTRMRSLGADVDTVVQKDLVKFIPIDPAELTPGELSSKMRVFVEQEQRLICVIDSLNGYLQSVPEENFLTLHMHELLTYLGQRGTTTLMVLTQSGVIGPAIETPVDLTYLADSVLLLRYFESDGAVRQAISVIKKRSGKTERTLREYSLHSDGIKVGEPLSEFHGVLSGVPTYRGDGDKLRR